MTKHRIIDTAYGEVMLKQSEVADNVLECYDGDNFDAYIGEIDGTLQTAKEVLIKRVERDLF